MTIELCILFLFLCCLVLFGGFLFLKKSLQAINKTKWKIHTKNVSGRLVAALQGLKGEEGNLTPICWSPCHMYEI